MTNPFWNVCEDDWSFCALHNVIQVNTRSIIAFLIFFDDIALTSKFDNTAAESNIKKWKLTQYGMGIILACLVPCPWRLFKIFKAWKSQPTCSPPPSSAMIPQQYLWQLVASSLVNWDHWDLWVTNGQSMVEGQSHCCALAWHPCVTRSAPRVIDIAAGTQNLLGRGLVVYVGIIPMKWKPLWVMNFTSYGKVIKHCKHDFHPIFLSYWGVILIRWVQGVGLCMHF